MTKEDFDSLEPISDEFIDSWNQYEDEEHSDGLPSFEGKGFSIRAVAHIIDMILLVLFTYGTGLFVALVIVIISNFIGLQIDFLETDTGSLERIVAAINFVVYFIVFEGFLGTSPGKSVLKMRVIQRDGTPCTFTSAAIRGVFRYVDGFLFGFIAYRIMEEPLQQRLGDEKAETIVVSSNLPEVKAIPEKSSLFLAIVVYAFFLFGLQSIWIMYLYLIG